MTRLLLGLLLLAPGAPSALGKPAPASAEQRRVLRLAPGAERHIRERHFPGGRQSRGKSLFYDGTDLLALLREAERAKPVRQKNGRDKRVADAGRPIGTDGRSGRPVSTYCVISEPDGLVITAYPGV